MIKRVVALLVAASLLSAGLLTMGITLMSRFAPASASELDALVASSSVSGDTAVAQSADDEVAATGTGRPKAQPFAAVDGSSTGQRVSVSVNTLAGGPVGEQITVAQLLSDPQAYASQPFAVAGVITGLGDDRFLLNDGTGQVLVDIDDDDDGVLRLVNRKGTLVIAGDDDVVWSGAGWVDDDADDDDRGDGIDDDLYDDDDDGLDDDDGDDGYGGDDDDRYEGDDDSGNGDSDDDDGDDNDGDDDDSDDDDGDDDDGDDDDDD